MLTDAVDERQVSLLQLASKCRLTLGISRFVKGSAEGVAGRNESTAIGSMGTMQGRQLGADHPDSQGGRGVALHTVLSLQVGLDRAGVDDRVRKQKPSIQAGPTRHPTCCTIRSHSRFRRQRGNVSCSQQFDRHYLQFTRGTDWNRQRRSYYFGRNGDTFKRFHLLETGDTVE